MDAAYLAYRARYRSVFTRIPTQPGGAGQAAIDAFREKFKDLERSFEIAFIGVWDTVDAVGMPFGRDHFAHTFIYQFKFPTQNLSLVRPPRLPGAVDRRATRGVPAGVVGRNPRLPARSGRRL